MISRYFIIEGKLEKFLLQHILPQEIVAQSKFLSGSSYTGTLAKARSALMTFGLPVTVIVDSKTTFARCCVQEVALASL